MILLTLVAILMPSCDNEITEEYTLTIIVNPSGGGITSPAVGSHDYTDGTEVNVTATAADGYVFDHWSGDVEETATSVNTTMASNKSITANFALTYDLTVNVEPVEAGEVILSEEGPYKEDMEVTLTATPADGYVFDHWSGDFSGDTNPVTITMDSDKPVTAHFTPVTYTLTVIVSASKSDAATVDIYPDLASYEPGTKVTLTVSLNSDNYEFLGWQVYMGPSLGTDNPITITMDSFKTIYAVIDCHT